jgi:tRNA A-37 threonylcarbamoyl transferase component Bud32
MKMAGQNMSTVWQLVNRRIPFTVASRLANLDAAFAVGGQCASPGRRCSVIRFIADGHAYYVKRYQAAGRLLHRWFGHSRLRREWTNLNYLHSCHIPVPDVLAFGQQRVCGVFQRGALITEEVAGAMDLARMARERPDLLGDQAWRHHVIRLLARYVGRLHRHRFIYQDLKWRNILVSASFPPAVYFIDCPSGGFRAWNWRLRRGIIRDLASLDKTARQYVSPRDRLRFYRQYRGITRLTENDKRQIRRIVQFRSTGEARRRRAAGAAS